jgi:hypothetical protein
MVELDAARRVEVDEPLLGTDLLQRKHIRRNSVDHLRKGCDLGVVVLLRRRSVPLPGREQVLNVPGHHR